MPAQPNSSSAKFLVPACAALLLLSGCGRMRDSLNSNTDIRKGAVDNARKSCVQTAMSKLPNATPDVSSRVSNYCDCFATKGLDKFSNSELMEIGLSGGKLTDETKVKLNQAVQMCVSNLQPQKP